MVAPGAASLTKFLAAPPLAIGGFLFYGSDALQIAARAEALSRALLKKLGPDAELARLHDTDLAADPDRVIVELTTRSLFGGTRIVWLTSLPAKAQAIVQDAIARPFDGAFLIAQAPDMKKSHKLAQSFEAAAYLAAIACYGEDRDSVVAGIRHQAAEAGYEIDGEAAALVVARCDCSALLARAETEKLITYAGEDRRITAAQVEDCLNDQQTAGLSDIVDAALDGDGRKAILAFERYMAAEANVSPVFVVLASSLLRLHALRAAVDAGASPMQAIKELRPPVFFKQQDALAAQVRKWTVTALAARLGDLNAALRDTRLKPALAEDIAARFLLTVAKEARAASRR
ncbi:DNA polymerase III subunit delta [Rhodomicrobium vannielii ATCC 17100]|uniref:DNA polymerase III subunit delta n=1 Tax=Rhodomicrobium vannielii TaxID=1069 RepID=UPI00191AE883|nr:DNA polymerase III subunit delta [Rhodomicrobium vannielii]MBJ7535099.1 DNA polymerase III subunit delta [Rhodomicrobium vannielii ATCC 17100]